MAHDVLISYSSRDKLQADAICNRLESRGIRCWIAPRDVGLGEYAEKIVEAIEKARIMVLVYSANADESHQVRREVERAVSKGTTIVPVRIEDHEMSKAFELYVGSMHWLDAITPPLEEHIDKLADQLQALLGRDAAGAAAAPVAGAAPAPTPSAAPARTVPPSASPAPAPATAGGRGKLMIGIAAGIVITLILLLLLGRSSDDGETETDASAQAAAAGEASGRAASVDVDTVEMTFENEMPEPVLVYWVNDDEEELYATLEPGDEWIVDTYDGHHWVVRSAADDGETIVTECTAPAYDSTCVALLINGYNVAWVGYEEFGSDVTGAFVQTGSEAWEEQDAEGRTRFRFSEIARDEWSVNLRDAGRRVEIELDLWNDQVMYSDANSPEPRLLYSIVEASD